MGVQQKLSLLLTLPLAAVVLTSAPFAGGRVDEAVSAGATVGVARDARRIAALIQDLQQERLLALAYLGTPDTQESAFVTQAAASADRAHEVAGQLTGPPGDELWRAVEGLSSLADMRRSVLSRSVSTDTVYDGYHERVRQLVDALHLTSQPRADATGLRQMGALEALLRTNEESSRIGAGVVMASIGNRRAASLVAEAQALRLTEAARFREQAAPEQAALFGVVERGPNAEQMSTFAGRAASGGTALPLSDLLATALTSITLARALQERIAHDIAVRAERRAAKARIATIALIGLVVLLVAGVVWLGFVVSRSVARPLRRLTTAAGLVADLAAGELVRVADSDTTDTSPPRLAAVDIRSSDEIGELAVAFNRVQATAALLMEQQVATRRNVAAMFANIARRTRSLVVRQLSFIDELERNERNDHMLGKLYRLDHLTTRLRRSAESLFVVSGVREDERIATVAPLVDVIRSAVAEIEGYQAVHVGAVCDVTVLPQLVPDLRLLLAELLENATAFSPPSAAVEVTAELADGCRIVIVDHGIGMADQRLAEENQRLVQRERLDIAPTRLLGLFVVGRLARRHGLRVRLDHSAGQGVTVEVSVPATLFTVDRRSMTRLAPPPAAVAALALPGQRSAGHAVPSTRQAETQPFAWIPHLSVPEPKHDEAFAWFAVPAATGNASEPPTAIGPAEADAGPAEADAVAPVEPVASVDAAASGEAASGETAATAGSAAPRGGLNRRQPGVHLAAFGRDRPAGRPAGATRDPRIERAELDAFVLGTRQAALMRESATESVHAAHAPARGGPGRGGLTRRVPGANLPELVDVEGPASGSAPPVPPTRDPDAERAALDSFVAGLERAAAAAAARGRSGAEPEVKRPEPGGTVSDDAPTP